MQISVNEPVITEEAKANVIDALETGWISSRGTYIDQFEEEFAKFIGVKHAVMTTSGTTALHLSLVALEIGPGDEVIVPDFTMFASIASILYTGAMPVLVDADRETYCIDPALIEAKITSKTKAIMPVHIYGHPVDMDPVMDIAAKNNLKVVEDAAEVHGATYKGKKCGSMGDMNAFSFYGNKIVTTGEGGMVVTNDDALADSARLLKDLSHKPGERFTHDKLGFNFRPTNLQGALGLGQLEHINEFIEKKQWMADRYAEGLKEVNGLRLPITKDYATNVYWMYAILVEDEFGMTRDELRAKLGDVGVDTRNFFKSSASQPALQSYSKQEENFPVSEDLAAHGLYLPSGLALTQEQVDYVCTTIKNARG